MLLLLSFLSLFYIRAGKRADPRTATQHSRAAVTQWLQIKADKANSLTLTHPDMLLISSQPETDQRCSSVEEGTTPTSVRLFLWGLWEEKKYFSYENNRLFLSLWLFCLTVGVKRYPPLDLFNTTVLQVQDTLLFWHLKTTLQSPCYTLLHTPCVFSKCKAQDCDKPHYPEAG